MFGEKIPSVERINIEEFRDKVLGCWTGKNIGGTLGTPLEGRREMSDLTFYQQELGGNPAPNDDLDLQLVWLLAVEQRGAYRLTERALGEYWMRYISGPWNEYGTAKANIVNGLYPPLSGFCNNEKWKYSNGAWIRSEVWACLFPAAPDEVVRFAWLDACVDHCGEGIYAEIFTAVLESAAFVERDVRKLIDIALARIPADCRVARSVKLAMECYDSGIDWRTARNRIVEESADLGWFQAPANLGFVVLGLLYGEGDFGRSICIAVNCGDDTDCTGATVGAILGILMGRKNLPQKWTEPIGNTIRTVAVQNYQLYVPATLEELTDRVIHAKLQVERENPTLPHLSADETRISETYRERFVEAGEAVERVLARSSRALGFDLPWGVLTIDYGTSPVTAPGETQKLTLTLTDCPHDNRLACFDWQLPEGWTMNPGASFALQSRQRMSSSITVEITPGEFRDSVVYLPVSLRLSDRRSPLWLTVPFQLRGAIGMEELVYSEWYKDDEDRLFARRAEKLF